jgi:hypothetical protein
VLHRALAEVDLQQERNLAVWWSSVLFLGAAAGCLLAFAADRTASQRRGRRTLDLGWLVLAAALAALSFDEVASLHEAIGHVPDLNLFEGYLRTWVGVFALPMLAATCGLLAFAWERLRRQPRVGLLFLLGVALFAAVPVQEHVEGRIRMAGGSRPLVFALLEEGCEMAGALAFLAAGLRYAVGRARALDLRLVVPAPAAYGLILGLVLALGTGLALVEFVLPHLGGGPVYGTPEGWLAGVASLVAGVVALATWHVRRPAPEHVAWFFAALVALLLATDLGSGGALTGEPGGAGARRLSVRVTLIAWTFAAAGSFWVAGAAWPVRYAASLWMLGAAAVPLGVPGAPWLALTGAGALLAAAVAARGYEPVSLRRRPAGAPASLRRAAPARAVPSGASGRPR